MATVQLVECNNQPAVTGYEYDLIGNLDLETRANGTIADYEYDNLNRLTSLTHYGKDATPDDLSDNPQIASFAYTLRADGKRIEEAFGFDEDGDGLIAAAEQGSATWDYDNHGRLIHEVFEHYDDLLDQTQFFTYDLAGNRLDKTLDKGNDGVVNEHTLYDYDANDRLLTPFLLAECPRRDTRIRRLADRV